METPAVNCPFALNNEGVQLAIECSSFENAYICFSIALEECQKILVNMAGSPSSLRRIIIRETKSMGFQADWFVGLPSTPIESCFIYDRLLTVPKESENSSYADYVQLSFVLLFNLAITTQMQVKNVSSERTHLLQEALRLYNMAHAVQSQRYFQVPASCLFGLVNNLGQIHKALGEKSKSHQCFEHLLALCMVALVAGQADMSDLQDYFSSTIPVILNESSTAPAA